MVSIEDYRKDPCRASSLPYWKTNTVAVPDNMMIIHHRNFIEEEHRYTIDTIYFRLIHHLKDLPAPRIAQWLLCLQHQSGGIR